MFFPEPEWGVVLLPIPMAIFLLTYPFLLARQLRVKAGLVMAMTILVFLAIGTILIGSASSEEEMLAALVSVGLVILLMIAARRAFVSRDQWLEALPNLLLACGAAAASVMIKFSAGGWLMIPEIGTGIMLAVPVFHANLHTIFMAAIARTEWTVPRSTVVPVLSDVALVLAAMLRRDSGDGHGWLTC